jgi:hypothetical protein
MDFGRLKAGMIKRYGLAARRLRPSLPSDFEANSFVSSLAYEGMAAPRLEARL